MSVRGRFITFEGIDGAGKSSHLDFACELVRARGLEAVKTFEPGGTPFGQKLREVVLHQPASALAEALAMFAARSAHVEALIAPALQAGRWVICDRFSDSTYAYQCGGRLLPREIVTTLEELVHPGLQPDATFLFDIDPATAATRQRAREREPDEFERRQLDFHMRVRNAYLERRRAHPGRIHLIDASGSIEEVRSRFSRAFAEAFA
ncbi:MAG TPA: dTMP kinase [Usitatibacter sp.]|nr:dTMP kinase [Usitatibacter sp.]